jgi:hypothetical protein
MEVEGIDSRAVAARLAAVIAYGLVRARRPKRR